jgi:hypothetical protein
MVYFFFIFFPRTLVEAPDSGFKLHTYLCVQCGAVSRLVSWWLHGIQEDKHPQIFCSEDLLFDIAKVVSTILRTQSIRYIHLG